MFYALLATPLHSESRPAMGERPDLKRMELLAKLDEFRWEDVKGLISYAAQLEARERAYREALRPLWNLAEAMETMPAPVEWERLREPLWDAVQDAATAYSKALAANPSEEEA